MDGDAVYVVDWGGRIYRINRKTGATVWSHLISYYTTNAKSLSRTAPAISDDAIVFGDQAGSTVIAVDKKSGELIWQKTIDTTALSVITGSPVIAGNVVYVGVASLQEGAAANPSFTPTFRGSVVALDLATGNQIWRFMTVPDGYTGGSVWGSNPVVDPGRNSLYVATGNNYTVPSNVATCIKAASDVAHKTACLAKDDYIDSILALDLTTGSLKWARRLEGPDTWNVGCIFTPGSFPCPDPSGPDYDFGSAPNLFTVGGNNGNHNGYGNGNGNHNGGPASFDVVGAGQKSGVYWALNPDTGETIWATQVGPGGTLGGIEWGSATDGQRVYVAITNNSHTTYTLAGGGVWNAGSWAALDAATGKILWQIPVTGKNPISGLNAEGLGSVSVANSVMFAGSTSGDMVAIDGGTGQILWTFASGGSVIDGPSIVADTVYWGSGYSHFNIGKSNNKVYAFTLP